MRFIGVPVTCHTFLLPAGAGSDGCPISVGGETWDLEFSPEGGLLGMADSYTDTVYIWDVATGELVGTDQRAGVNMRGGCLHPGWAASRGADRRSLVCR